MTPEEEAPRYLFFASYRLDCRTGELQRSGRKVKLQAQPARLLVLLASRGGELVSRTEIQEALWGGDTFVDFEHGINFSISQIRDALGDSAENPRYVETVPRAGYRFIPAVEGSERGRQESERSPYPGLLSFSSTDAEFFFGREEEVQALWAKFERRQMLALIGPSGAGKSSLLQAGLVPGRPRGWGVVICRPRENAFSGLGQALLGLDEQANPVRDTSVALALLGQWRGAHSEALLCVDGFEELFTTNDEESRARFCELLGKAAESGIHVLLAMRDDFFVHCHDYPELEPIFHEVTPLKPPRGAALRRVLVEPARKCGYRFEDEALVAEILGEVTNERGALPLVAFAAARMWEKRDRGRCVLTRKAYMEIGGVGGALAQHAEASLAAVGPERQEVVREIFRNLTTAKGTRASQKREEILSVFEEREEAARVLQKFIDARLLTSAEEEIEVVHESLLTAWPRLVQWQAQEAEAAVVRDRLRQAARAWQERGRPEDLLWRGTSYGEIAFWRERYQGGLTTTEQAFVEASRRLAERTRRRRRGAVTALVTAALAVAVITSSLWQQAKRDALRAEAAQLLALGRLELDDHPTSALAYALASLERSDEPEVRRFALEALARGAAAYIVPIDGDVQSVSFSPDGRWLATGGLAKGIRLWSREGGPPRMLGETDGVPEMTFDARSELLVIKGDRTLRFLSVPDGKEMHRVDVEGPFWFYRRGARVLTFTETQNGRTVRSWPLGRGEARDLGSWDDSGVSSLDVSQSGDWLGYAQGRMIFLRSLENLETSTPRILGTHESRITRVRFKTDSDRLVSADETGEIRIWSLETGRAALERAISAEPGMNSLDMDAEGSRLVAARPENHDTPETAAYWSLNGPPDAEPRVLRHGDALFFNSMSIDPRGLWLATTHNEFAVLWPLGRPETYVFRGQPPPRIQVAFTPDGKWLASSSAGGGVRLWPLSPAAAPRHRIVLAAEEQLTGLAINPTGQNLLAGGLYPGRAFLVPLDGNEPRSLPRFSTAWVERPAFSADGRLAAAGTRLGPKGNLIELWDLDSWSVRALDPRVQSESCGWGNELEGAVWSTGFTSGGGLVTAGVTGLRLWDLSHGTSVLLKPCRANTIAFLAASARDRFLLAEVDHTHKDALVTLHDLRSHTSRELSSHGNRVSAVALDPTGEIAVTGDFDGVVRVGPVNGGEPHLLYGHRLWVSSVAISPDGRWIASASQDGTIRLWPMPKGRPFHTLSYEETLERLRSFTNLLVIRDEGNHSGYRVGPGPFPGWATLPEW